MSTRRNGSNGERPHGGRDAVDDLLARADAELEQAAAEEPGVDEEITGLHDRLKLIEAGRAPMASQPEVHIHFDKPEPPADSLDPEKLRPTRWGKLVASMILAGASVAAAIKAAWALFHG